MGADLTKERFERAPLQPGVEASWSRWLARLLQPSKALGTELFNLAVERAPSEVIREDHLPKQDGSFRRPDILLCHENRGVSIEVKMGDENYQKTAETARLVERHYDDRECTHVLLLPKQKRQRLASVVEPPLTQRGDRMQVA